MTNFITIKVHYDHRPALAPHLKYSRTPTSEEYNEYLDRFHEDGIGGGGFHECLNYAIPDEEGVRIYLPPTCLPAKKKLEEEFVIFSFIYAEDDDIEMRSHIIGVHAGARYLSRDGIVRPDIEQIEGIDALTFHAEAPSDMVTLFNPPLYYNCKDGIYTPPYGRWGYGLRYIEKEHAQNIIDDSLERAKEELLRSTKTKKMAINRQIEVLNRIKDRYFLSEELHEKKGKTPSFVPHLPDKELGYLGEREVYERELAYVKKLGKPASDVEWISQTDPQSPFDIKSVRKTKDGGYCDHFIEVKSSRVDNYANIYVSARQIEFFENNKNNGIFMFIIFDISNKVKEIQKYTLRQLYENFELVPIKYKLRNLNGDNA